MDRRIVGFGLDADHHWVAKLECGHNQHVRHDPPWTNRSGYVARMWRRSACAAAAATVLAVSVAPPASASPPVWRPLFASDFSDPTVPPECDSFDAPATVPGATYFRPDEVSVFPWVAEVLPLSFPHWRRVWLLSSALHRACSPEWLGSTG